MAIKTLFIIISLIISWLSAFNFVRAQEIDIIKLRRTASNEALRNLDDNQYLTFLTEDVLITTGSGNLISGKTALKAYIQKGGDTSMYWVRTPNEIQVNPETNLAWESGTWEGFYTDSDAKIMGGNYSAMWTKASGVWLIKSQLFVTLVD